MAKKKKSKGKKKSSGGGGGKKGEMLLVGSKTKDALRKHKVNVAGDAIEGLNAVVHWYIEQAATRAKENKRKTVRGHDFIA